MFFFKNRNARLEPEPAEFVSALRERSVKGNFDKVQGWVKKIADEKLWQGWRIEHSDGELFYPIEGFADFDRDDHKIIKKPPATLFDEDEIKRRTQYVRAILDELSLSKHGQFKDKKGLELPYTRGTFKRDLIKALRVTMSDEYKLSFGKAGPKPFDGTVNISIAGPKPKQDEYVFDFTPASTNAEPEHEVGTGGR